MGDIKGFRKHLRVNPDVEDVQDRILHFKEFEKESPENMLTNQASRCMDCGVPFCHSSCPLGNKIPEFNDSVHNGKWEQAFRILISTNNFPEFTGRICPAPCEASCVLGINSDPVSIESIEKSIIEKAFDEGWVTPVSNIARTGKKVTIVGSGPAGLAAADQLNKAGHQVTVYEKNKEVGGLLRYGIPDFKLSKSVIDRRVAIMKEEGVQFKCNIEVGKDISPIKLMESCDSLLLSGGAESPRDLPIEGRALKGVCFAMDYLVKNNKRVAREEVDFSEFDLKGKNVVVIGGGDTGSDCIGTSRRLGAKTITQIELQAKPPISRDENNPWPLWPMVLKTSSSHREGCDREWSILTKRFISNDGVSLSGLEVVDITWEINGESNLSMVEKQGTTRIIECDFAFLAIGFTHPIMDDLNKDLDIELLDNKLVKATDYMTSMDGVFTAGDMRRGQSLVVWAIAEGRESAVAIDKYMMKEKAKLRNADESILTI